MSEEPITPNPEHHSGIKEAVARAVLVGAGITAAMGIGGAAHADEAAPSPAPSATPVENVINDNNMLLGSPSASPTPVENVINDNGLLQEPKELPNTGSPTDLLPVAGAGIVLVAGGTAAVAYGRKREEDTPKA